uniref:hypothetical protein n=1 Tax=Prevotella sp. TaxID=59823 RepID=UPI004026F15A
MQVWRLRRLFAKDIKTVVFTTTPQMHCAACENKIKSNLRFEKGLHFSLVMMKHPSMIEISTDNVIG